MIKHTRIYGMDRFNLESFETLKSNMGSIMPELINIFIEDSQKSLQQIQSGIEASDTKQINSAAHSLKSSASNMGARLVSELSAKIEEKSTNALHEDLPSLYEQVNTEMNRVTQIIKSL